MRHFARFGLALALLGSMGSDCESAPAGERCSTSADCDEGGRCSAGHCVYCYSAGDCSDGLWCNGQEACMGGVCEDGPDPCTSPTSLCEEGRGRADCRCAAPDVDGDGADSMSCGGTDCDDDDPRRAPGRPEVCDASDLDEDCDPTTFGNRDADGDGWGDAACCNGDGAAGICGDDCDDTRGDVHPTEAESCDQRDNDCDGAIDEGVLVTAYRDVDGDGWGDGAGRDRCAGASGFAIQDGDCDDEDPQLVPGAFRCAGSGPEIDICDGGRWSEDDCPGAGQCVPQPDGTGVCLEGTPQCSDGSDNDGDGQIDASDTDCGSPLDNREAAARCDDGLDNDGDDVSDYPGDPGCTSTEDTNEADPATAPACANGDDDDMDGTIDWLDGAGDPGCISASDNSERESHGPQCDNGIDDDGDTDIDFGAKATSDPQCLSPLDDNEGLPACSNGLDDDGDGWVDSGADPGCIGAGDESEREAGGASCDNGLDDDMDGAADFPGDTSCTDAQDVGE